MVQYIELIKIHATWCAPCRRLGLLLEDLMIETKDYDVDTKEGQEMATKYGVVTVPLLIYGDKRCDSSDATKVKAFLTECDLI